MFGRGVGMRSSDEGQGMDIRPRSRIEDWACSFEDRAERLMVMVRAANETSLQIAYVSSI